MATIAIGIAPNKSAGPTATVPLDALAADGVPPASGDDVSFSVDGTVQSVSGSSAKVKINAIDGNPVGAGSGAESEGPADQASEPGGEPANEPSGPGNLSGMSAADLGARLKKRAAKGGPPPLM